MIRGHHRSWGAGLHYWASHHGNRFSSILCADLWRWQLTGRRSGSRQHVLRMNGDHRCWRHRSHRRNHRGYDLPARLHWQCHRWTVDVQRHQISFPSTQAAKDILGQVGVATTWTSCSADCTCRRSPNHRRSHHRVSGAKDLPSRRRGHRGLALPAQDHAPPQEGFHAQQALALLLNGRDHRQHASRTRGAAQQGAHGALERQVRGPATPPSEGIRQHEPSRLKGEMRRLGLCQCLLQLLRTLARQAESPRHEGCKEQQPHLHGPILCCQTGATRHTTVSHVIQGTIPLLSHLLSSCVLPPGSQDLPDQTQSVLLQAPGHQ
mmetsp:Transcript_59244/g.129997  ORF Transcript_59244/g.129997 Transcript_59244/m.129997 type:complete len:321 (-) Transcript_59244:1841-2803(-)